MWRIPASLVFLTLSACGDGNDEEEPLRRDYQCEVCADFDTAVRDCEALLESSDCEVGVSVYPDLPRFCGGEGSSYCVFHECAAAPACDVPVPVNEGGAAGE